MGLVGWGGGVAISNVGPFTELLFAFSRFLSLSRSRWHALASAAQFLLEHFAWVSTKEGCVFFVCFLPEME